MEKMVEKRILITGNTGYVGPVLSRSLKKSRSDTIILGFDVGYFSHCLTYPHYNPLFDIDKQFWGDIREFPQYLFDGVDSIVHLAAISNDPMGKSYEKVTTDINLKSSVNFAKSAKKLE